MRLTLTRKIQETSDVWSFFFEPTEPVTWQAGQSIRLELPRKTWGVDERRFTIASAPHEGHIRITTRLSDSSFKQTLVSLEPESVIQGFNIEGTCVWDNSPLPKTFLAAGIGITPFRALLSQAVHDSLPLDVTLIYQSREDPPLYIDELQAWQQEHPGLTLTITQDRITLPEDIRQWQQSLIYISGPEQMVKELSLQLVKAGTDPSRIKTDLFTGIV